MLRVINEGTVEGLSQAKTPPTHDRLFYQNLRHSNEVFAAFKVHQMGEDMAAKLFDASGNLKSFDKWVRDVSSISSHQVGAWLRTEYDTAVIRAHAAADWQEFERNKDIFPNLRWMPTTSPEPESTHAAYWRMKLTLPVDDPFWNEHHPGDRWNCKCSLEATDEPVVRPAGLEPTQPQRGLENNPGKDGKIFNDTHPYFPKDCSSCPFNGGLKNKLQALFSNTKKDCNNCGKIDAKLPKGKGTDGKLSAEEKHKIYSQPLERQFIRVAPGVKKHVLKYTDEEDYKRVLSAAKLYAKHDDVMIMPEIHAKETEIRALLGVPSAKKIPDLKVGSSWVDVKSPLKYRNIIHNAIEASEQGAIACISDDRVEINERSLLQLSRRIIENKDYSKPEVHFSIKGVLYKYNSQGLIPG